MEQINEFYVSKSELDMDLDIGETGKLMIPVEVIAIDKENYLVRKAGKIEAEGSFAPETVKDMRSRIGVVEDEEMPVNSDEE